MAGSDNQTEDLEKALLERATRLADEYLQRARQQREDIHHELREKLHISEERELLAAREKGERVYQQRVQATELQLQSRLDNLRWQLVGKIMDELLQSLRKLVDDESEYLPILKHFLQEAATAIPGDQIVIQVNQKDYQRFENNPQLLQEWVVNKEIILSDEICDCSGGIRVRDAGNHVRIDNTFEGRIAVLHEQIEENIMEHLFSKTLTTGEMIHG